MNTCCTMRWGIKAADEIQTVTRLILQEIMLYYLVGSHVESQGSVNVEEDRRRVSVVADAM